MFVEATLLLNTILLAVIGWRLIAGAERFNRVWGACGSFVVHHWPMTIGIVAVGVVAVKVGTDANERRQADIEEASRLHRSAILQSRYVEQSINADRTLDNDAKTALATRIAACIDDAASPTLWIPVPNLTDEELTACYDGTDVPETVREAANRNRAAELERRTADLMGTDDIVQGFVMRPQSRKSGQEGK